MSEDLAMDSQVGPAPEAGLPEVWREHVRELRSENARRRRENVELRAQLASVSDRLREAESAQTAAADRSSRDGARLAAVHRRLKEAEAARLAREALRAAAARRQCGAGVPPASSEAGKMPAPPCGAGVPPASSEAGKMPAPPPAGEAAALPARGEGQGGGAAPRLPLTPPADGGRAGSPGGPAVVDLSRATAGLSSRAPGSIGTVGQADRGTGAALVDLGRAARLLERVGLPVDLDRDLSVDDEGRVGLAPEAGERLARFVEELVDLVAVETRVAPPPVGGEPPRTAEGGLGPIVNSWDPEGQTSPAGKARAAVRRTAAENAAVLDGLVQL